jgi:DNA-binding transcriptional LysR family regulator
MEIHHLKIFTSVYRHKSFSKASKEIKISQPTISEHMKNLETELGCLLFDRMGRSIIPTKEAEFMFPKAMHIIEETERLKESVIASSGEIKGEILLGASTIPGSYLLPELCNSFKIKHPDVSFRVVIEDSRKVTEMLLAHEVLLGVAGSRLDSDKLRHVPFYKDELVLVASPKLGIKSPLTLKALTRLPFIFREEGSGTRKAIFDNLTDQGISMKTLNVTAVLGSSDAVKQAVKASLGVSMLSRVSVKDELKANTLMEIKIRGLKLQREFYIITHKKRVLPSPYNVYFDFLNKESKSFADKNLTQR